MKTLEQYITEAQNILYVGIELQNESKKTLINLFNKFNPWKGDNVKVICHHSTIAFGNAVDEIIDWVNQNKNKEIELEATEIGNDEKACAVKVEPNIDVPYQNKIHHITLAVNNDNRGKPVDSNNIEKWKTMQRIKLKGNVKIYYKH